MAIKKSLIIPSFKVTASTYGNGLWSDEARKVTHSRAKLMFYLDREQEYFASELRVFFPKKCWDISKHGLIYTDKNWIKEIKRGLSNLGYSQKAIRKVDYSEQGMQGDNYVSLDVDQSFVKETLQKFKTKRN